MQVGFNIKLDELLAQAKFDIADITPVPLHPLLSDTSLRPSEKVHPCQKNARNLIYTFCGPFQPWVGGVVDEYIVDDPAEDSRFEKWIGI